MRRTRSGVIPQAVFLLETRREPSGLGNREGREARNSHASMYNIFCLDANRAFPPLALGNFRSLLPK